MAHTPGPPTGNQPRRDDVLVVKGVGEKRTPGQWAILIGIPGLLVVVGVVVVLALTHTRPQVKVQSRATQQTPGAPQAAAPAAGQPRTGAPTATSPAGTPGATTVPDTAGTTPSPAPTTSAGAAVNVSGAAVWEGFRGPGRMNISGEALARTFPASGPRRLWQLPLGEGHAGAAVYKGRVYVLDYNAGARRDELKCLDLSSGKQLWSQGYSVDIKSNHGMSRTVPAVTDQYVVTLDGQRLDLADLHAGDPDLVTRGDTGRVGELAVVGRLREQLRDAREALAHGDDQHHDQDAGQAVLDPVIGL